MQTRTDQREYIDGPIGVRLCATCRVKALPEDNNGHQPKAERRSHCDECLDIARAYHKKGEAVDLLEQGIDFLIELRSEWEDKRKSNRDKDKRDYADLSQVIGDVQNFLRRQEIE